MESTPLAGKVALVTGANAGIGFETTIELARLGARVVMVARDRHRGDAASAAARSRSGSADIELLLCDMSSMPAVRGLAEAFRARHSRVDILVNNAGSVSPVRRTTAEGFEWTFAANYLGHFLLTNLLLDLLRRSAPARVVNVSSAAHRGATMDFDNLQFQSGDYSTLKAYGRSKLAQILFTTELARKLEGTGVTVNALHPGAVATGIWARAEPPWYAALVIAAAKLFMLAPARAAERVVFLAASPDVSGQTGGYYEKNRLVDPSPRARDAGLAKRLWNESEQMAGLRANPT